MRAKLKTTAPATRDEMETLVGEITSLKIQERALKAAMDEAIKRTKDDYQARLAEVTGGLAARLPRAMAWAEAHPEDFGKVRSIEMLHGILGWRVTPPALKTVAGWTWDRVLEKLEAIGQTLYVRVKSEVNKAALLNDRDLLGAEQLRSVGVRVVQEDEFFVEPKLTNTPAREVINR